MRHGMVHDNILVLFGRDPPASLVAEISTLNSKKRRLNKQIIKKTTSINIRKGNLGAVVAYVVEGIELLQAKALYHIVVPRFTVIRVV